MATSTMVYTRNGNPVARNSLSYIAYLEGVSVLKLRAAIKRKGVKDLTEPFEVTLTSGTIIANKKVSGKKVAA